MRSTETGHIRQIGKKWYITISLLVIMLVSCSDLFISDNKLPKKVKYTESKFVECPETQEGYLCIKNSQAINNVLDFKKCQEQNELLRELINGN